MFISEKEKNSFKDAIVNVREAISQVDQDVNKLIEICKGLNKRIAKLEGVKMVDKRTLPKSKETYEKHRLAMKKYWAERKAKEAQK